MQKSHPVLPSPERHWRPSGGNPNAFRRTISPCGEFVNRYNFGRPPDKSAAMMPAQFWAWQIVETEQQLCRLLTAFETERNNGHLFKWPQPALRPVEIAGGTRQLVIEAAPIGQPLTDSAGDICETRAGLARDPLLYSHELRVHAELGR